jgi:hypothetical protein
VNISEMIEQIQGFGKMSDVRHVTTFKGQRRSRDGRTREVTVQIQDAGARAQGTRYCITATDEDGREAIGGPHDGIGTALHSLPWKDLDEHSPD